MRESMYVDDYLATTTDAGRRVTPGTYLAGQLRGEARRWSGRYQRALMRALARREAAGDVVAVPSVRGGIAYVRSAP